MGNFYHKVHNYKTFLVSLHEPMPNEWSKQALTYIFYGKGRNQKIPRHELMKCVGSSHFWKRILLYKFGIDVALLHYVQFHIWIFLPSLHHTIFSLLLCRIFHKDHIGIWTYHHGLFEHDVSIDVSAYNCCHTLNIHVDFFAYELW